MVTVGELASALGLALGSTDPDIELTAIAPLDRAGPADLAFVAQKRYLPALRETRAACVLLTEDWREDCPVPFLVAEDPYLCYARASGLFRTEPAPEGVVDPSAWVHPTASLGAGVSIGACASVDAGAVIGDGVVIGAGARVGAGAEIGAGSQLYPNVVLYHGVRLGRDCVVHACSVIGSDGFGFARGPAGWEKIHQIGTVRIGDRVDIGSGVTIDRGALGDTVIADGVIIDNQVHIAHNCEIGERTAIAGCVGMAGSAVIGADCTFAGQVGVSGHVRICDNAHFAGQARVNRSVDEPGAYSSGTPLEKTRQWGKNAVRFSQLGELNDRVRALESQLAALSEAAAAATDAAGETPDDNEE
jgi:UDP-3-O-[3-hydroxymyristoyl] glucosamine N-acyltransferase